MLRDIATKEDCSDKRRLKVHSFRLQTLVLKSFLQINFQEFKVNQHHIGKVFYTLFRENDNLLYNSGMCDEVEIFFSKIYQQKILYSFNTETHSSALIRQPLHRVLCHVEC